jgi:hypothetical protein
MCKSLWIPFAAMAVLTMAVGPKGAYAVDGIILIDQNRALAGNITPGDAPGFPISITQPGSYRLSGNLTVPAATNGIEISASNVTIDLNGFSLLAPARVPGDFSAYKGVSATAGTKAITVRNGTISGFAFQVYLELTTQVLAEDLILNSGAATSTATSFWGGSASIVRRVVAQGPGFGTITVKCPAVVVECVIGDGTGTFNIDRSSSTACVVSNNAGTVTFFP